MKTPDAIFALAKQHDIFVSNDNNLLAFAAELEAVRADESATRPVEYFEEGHTPDHVNAWADSYDDDGGHGLIVQFLRAYAAMLAAPHAPSQPATGSK